MTKTGIHSPSVADPDLAGLRNLALWMLAHEAKLAAQLFGLPQIVRIEKRDQRRIRERDAAISRRRRTASLASLDGSAIESRELFQGSVGRAVIDDDQLEVRIALREHRFDRIGHHRAAVIGRNYYADFGRHFFSRRF